MSIPSLHDSHANRRRPPLFWLLGLVALAISVAGASWAIHTHNVDHPTRGHPETMTAKEDLTSVNCIGYVDVDGGIIKPYPAFPGRVEEVMVHENETVKANAPLLRIDDTQARFQVDEAKAAVRVAEEQLAEARTAPKQHKLRIDQQNAAIQALTHDRAAAVLAAQRKQKLVDKKQLPSEESEAAWHLVKKLDAALQAEQAKLQALELVKPARAVTLAEQNLRAKRISLQKAEQALKEHTLRAPTDGTVLRLFINRGTMLGAQAKEPALLFCPSTPRIVRAEVEQEFANQLAVGRSAIVQDDTNSAGPVWAGTVIRLSDFFAPRRSALPEPNQFQDVRTLECVIQLAPTQVVPRIGQRMRISVNTH